VLIRMPVTQNQETAVKSVVCLVSLFCIHLMGIEASAFTRFYNFALLALLCCLHCANIDQSKTTSALIIELALAISLVLNYSIRFQMVKS